MRQASLADLDELVGLMEEFYAEARYPLNVERAREAFQSLLGDERLGRVWLIEATSAHVGYMVLTLGYSMEYGGPDAFIDDLFVQPAFRGAGLGSAAVAEAQAFCLAQGIRALHLQVDRQNAIAQNLYRRAGFVGNERELLTLPLAAPTHAA